MADETLRDTLSTAYDQAVSSSDEPADTAAPAAQTPAPETTAPTTPAPETAAPTAETPSPAAPQVDLDAPPPRLKDRFGQSWVTLPDEVKKTFRDYESAIGRMGNRYGQAAQNWNQMQQVISPYEEMIRSEGGTPHRAVQSLLETARVLRQGHPEQKSAMVFGMLQAFQIPHQKLEDGRVVLLPPSTDPALLQRLSALEGQDLTARASRSQDLARSVDEELQTFLESGDRPYLRISGYEETMAMLIETGKAKDLQSAYEQAAWLHPESRELEVARKTSAGASERAQRAAAARTAAVSVPGNNPGALQPSTKGMSLRDELRARMSGEIM